MQTVEVRKIIIAVPLRIDDRTIEANLRGDRPQDMVRPLRELEIDTAVDLDSVEVVDPNVVHLMLAEAHDVVAEVSAVEPVPADPPYAREDLSRHQKRQQAGY